MRKENTISNNSTYYHLIATWVICEAFLGGIIHGLRLPVSGLIVGSCAVIIISLIAWYVPVRGAILKATLIVAIFKMMLSPQAPPPAYIAVFFQGLLGELLFLNRRFFRLSCLLLAVLALIESGLQRIFVLTILYGNDFWKVLNDFTNAITGQQRPFNYSLWFAGIYAFIHALVGVMVGWWAAVLPQKAENWNILINASGGNPDIPVPKKKRPGLKKALLITWILLIGLYIQSYYGFGNPVLSSHIVLKIFLRSIIIILAWVFLLKPAIQFVLERWLKKMKSKWQTEIKTIMELIPETKALMNSCWKRSATTKGISRIGLFSKMVVANLGPHIYILSGEVRSGKTTSLVSWSRERDDVFGILTPLVNGKKVFMNINTGEQFEMEANENDADPIIVGRYNFSRSAFSKAEQIIMAAADKNGWLVIDEIGPLELNGEGFSPVLKKLLAERKGRTILVIRDNDNMVSRISHCFGIEHPIINKIPGLRGPRSSKRLLQGEVSFEY